MSGPPDLPRLNSRCPSRRLTVYFTVFFTLVFTVFFTLFFTPFEVWIYFCYPSRNGLKSVKSGSNGSSGIRRAVNRPAISTACHPRLRSK